ncbi:Major facilitator superfamily domain general substrate transporter [Penicillium cf. griseofulvum]|uniref:Major facilitator superfamily domain general substrate transporter n=1 Tax=Penicillium cf. griseofulvum TaxID=2972120 RepID=A0A9W9JG42_9EURO|nr:Major facilitator superfamily domain general substrate transporter [Penicillium cf. griseofulvum]KAJ5444960.1 Major facilitator superfamily domain general substrate transporter [Penicillium cf. griseofulvum]KAJ5446674.1 Major facilitator superfamily domain general substrate transporter [Penicillium cf. griseofulvum]
MTSADEQYRSSSHAPLLASSHASSDHGDNDHDESLASELEYSGGWFIWALTFSAGISGLLFGYDTGVISSTLVTVGSDLSGHALTTLDKSLITSCTSLFALIASPFTGVLADKFGRRKVILGADLLFALGALVQAFTSHVWGMILGRSIVGLAVGSASAVTPLYISELAPSHARGRLVTILSLFITGGQVVAYIVGWLFSSTTGGWRWIVGIGAFPAFFQLAILALLPETPRWLVQAGFDTRAKVVLTKIYQDCPGCDLVVDRVLSNINGEIVQEASEMGQPKSRGTKPQWLHDTIQRGQQLLHGGNRRALIIAMMLQAVQQLCGFNSLMYFSATIFSSLSFSSPTLTSLSVAMTNFVFTLLAFVLIDKIGRRRILLYSIPVMVVALVVCAFSFSSMDGKWNSEPTGPQENHDNPSSLVPLAVLLCLTVYTAAYALGLGNVPWQQSELFPLNVRSLGSGLATATNWGSNFIIGLTFLPMMEWISPPWTFALYALVCVVGWVAVWAIYPEMSGLGLEEVRGLLADGWGVRESLQRRRLSRHI